MVRRRVGCEAVRRGGRSRQRDAVRSEDDALPDVIVGVPMFQDVEQVRRLDMEDDVLETMPRSPLRTGYVPPLMSLDWNARTVNGATSAHWTTVKAVSIIT